MVLQIRGIISTKIYISVMEYLQGIFNGLKTYCVSADYTIKQTVGLNLQLSHFCEKKLDKIKLQIVIGFVILALVILFAVLSAFFKKNRRQFKAKLISVKQVTHDTKIFTFDLPDGQNKIGLNVGEHLELEAVIDGKTVARKYTPISRADIKRNSFDLLIKIYRKTEGFPGGPMTQYLESLKVGDSIKVTLPYGRLNYIGNSQIQVKQLNGSVNRKKIDHIYLLGGGTGITPLFQIIQYITEVQQDANRPNLTLLFANRSEDDILVKGQLQDFQRRNSKLKCYFSVDKSFRQGWNGLVGLVDEQKIKKTIPKQIQNTFFAVCGTPGFCNLVQKLLLNKFNVRASQFYRF